MKRSIHLSLMVLLIESQPMFAQTVEPSLLEKILLIEQAIVNDSIELPFPDDVSQLLEEAQVSENLNLSLRARAAINAYTLMVQRKKNLQNLKSFEEAWKREIQKQNFNQKNASLNTVSSVALIFLGVGLFVVSTSSILGDHFFFQMLNATPNSQAQMQSYQMLAITDNVSLSASFVALGGAAIFFLSELLR